MAAPSGAEGLQRAGDRLRRARAALAKAIEEYVAIGTRLAGVLLPRLLWGRSWLYSLRNGASASVRSA